MDIDLYNNILGIFDTPNTIDVNNMYPKLDAQQCLEYIKDVELLKEVKSMNEPYMNRYCDEREKDIQFLFDTKNWNNNSIKEMTSSHIINSALMLLKRASEFKLNYELFVINNSSNRLLVPKDNISDLAIMDANIWIKTTPIFIAFTKELSIRGLLSYFDIVLTRLETEKLENK